MDRAQLADFLRRRREALRPGDVGLPAGARRRTPGLRREEVAGLVGMSTDYYARLEQRRGPRPSAGMLAAMAAGLRLTPDERDHLFRLAGHGVPPRARPSEGVDPGLLRVLGRLDDTPAQVMSALGETLAQNRRAAALLGDQTSFAGDARSVVYRWFTDPAERAIYPEADRERQGRALVANLRAAVDRGGDAARARALARRLRAESAEFARLWARHDVAAHTGSHKTLLHPTLGPIALDCHHLLSEGGDQVLLVFTATPGTVGVDKLARLPAISAERFATHPLGVERGALDAPAAVRARVGEGHDPPGARTALRVVMGQGRAD